MSTYLIYSIVVTFIWAAYIVITVAVDVNKKKESSERTEEIIRVGSDDNSDDSRYVSETDGGFSISNSELPVEEILDGNNSGVNGLNSGSEGSGPSPAEGGMAEGELSSLDSDGSVDTENYLSDSVADEDPDETEDELDYQIYQLKSECQEAAVERQDSYMASDFLIALSKPINNSTKIFCQMAKL